MGIVGFITAGVKGFRLYAGGTVALAGSDGTTAGRGGWIGLAFAGGAITAEVSDIARVYFSENSMKYIVACVCPLRLSISFTALSS
jgi:hypothetical protein